MIVTITPRKLSGTIAAIPSKSHVHRLLICAALGNRPATLPCRVVSQDIEATVRCLRALGAGIAVGGSVIAVTGLTRPSLQGDSVVAELLRRMGAEISIAGDSIAAAPAKLRETCIDVGDTPDLVPALAVAAAAVKGRTAIANVGRLRLKESDRVASVCGALNALGGHAVPDGNCILIDGCGSLRGGIVDACGDHRIAMLGAAASVLCSETVTITGAEAVDKSYPGFFDDFAALGGVVRTEA